MTSRRLRAAVLVAAALTLASVAGAARWQGVFSLLAPETASAPVATVPAAPPAPHAPRIDVARSAPPPAETAEPVTVPAPAPDPIPAPVAAPPVATPVAVAPSPRVTPVAYREPSAPAPVVAPPVAPPVDASGAPLLFSQANSARRQGDHARAASLYRGLLETHPDAAEASPTRVALARLLLDDGDARGALPLFETYLRSGDGALREEAMVGRARAFERLTRAADERAAWTALLQSYPLSIHAARARSRLEELERR